jgi:hypothetical protein
MPAMASPSARFRHTAVWTGVEMIVWGGFRGTFSGGSPLNTGGRYNPITDTWTPTRVAPSAIGATDAAPAPRVNHTAVWTGTRMIVWGGVSGTPVNSGALYDPVEKQVDGDPYRPQFIHGQRRRTGRPVQPRCCLAGAGWADGCLGRQPQLCRQRSHPNQYRRRL